MTTKYDTDAEVADWVAHSIKMHNAGCWPQADAALDAALLLKPSHHVAPVDLQPFKRVAWECGEPVYNSGDSRWAIHNLIHFGRRQAKVGDREVFAEYYKIKLGDFFLPGQRSAAERLKYLPDGCLTGKGVLDLGGNFGGMLHEVADDIKWGVGTDYDSRLVNTANRIAAYSGTGRKLSFYVHDLMSDPLEMVRDFMPDPRADIVFLLAVCAHLKNWNEVILFAGTLADRMLFEANGHEYEQLGQVRALHRAYGEVKELAGRGAPGIGSRRLLLCQNPKL